MYASASWCTVSSMNKEKLKNIKNSIKLVEREYGKMLWKNRVGYWITFIAVLVSFLSWAVSDGNEWYQSIPIMYGVIYTVVLGVLIFSGFILMRSSRNDIEYIKGNYDGLEPAVDVVYGVSSSWVLLMVVLVSSTGHAPVVIIVVNVLVMVLSLVLYTYQRLLDWAELKEEILEK